MNNSYITDSPLWVDKINQLETDDKVLGGSNKPANWQAQGLANRTAWLKIKIEGIEKAIPDLTDLTTRITTLEKDTVKWGEVVHVIGDTPSRKKVPSEELVAALEKRIKNLESGANSNGHSLDFGVVYPTFLKEPLQGCFFLDGRSFNKAENPKLAALYPNGLLPDWRERSLLGASTTYPIGILVGQQLLKHTHTPTMTTAGSHNHTGNTKTGGVHDHTAIINNAGAHSHGASSAAAGDHAHSGTANSAGNHAHTGSASSAGSHTHTAAAYYFSSGSYGESGHLFYSPTKKTNNNQLTVDAAGAHAHTLAINSAGAHTHSLAVNSAGSHSHTVTVNEAGAHTHTLTINKDEGHAHEISNDGGHTHTLTLSESGGSKQLVDSAAVNYMIVGG